MENTNQNDVNATQTVGETEKQNCMFCDLESQQEKSVIRYTCESCGGIQNTTKKLNAPTPFEIKTQKDVLKAEKDTITAIYFVGDKRILSYGGISYQKATIELIALQERENKIITMLIVKELPLGFTSWDIEDYKGFLVSQEGK